MAVKKFLSVYIIKFNHKDIYTKFCVCSHKKDIKHIDQTIHYVACVMHKWCDLGMLRVKNLGVEICDDAQSIIIIIIIILL